MKAFAGLIISLLISLCSLAQTALNAKNIDSVLSILQNTHRFNGTVLYAEKGKTIFSKAYGIADIRTKQPLTIASAFNLASVTKQFVAASIMILADKLHLAFDDDITRFIPELPYKGITIRNLLTHTSGLPEYFDVFTQYRSPLDTLNNEKLIQLFAERKPALEFATGSKWQYCNTNYCLLVSIIERISKQPFNIFFQERIAKPLGLKNTYLYHLQMPVVPANHVYGFAEKNGAQKPDDLTVMDGITGDGNLYSSVEDLLKWDQSLYTEKLVKKTSLAEAFTPVKLTNGSTYPYGFGWFIDKENEQYSHTGGWVGFRNIIIRDVKSQRTLIVLSSGENSTGIRELRAMFNGKIADILPTTLITNIQLVDGTSTPARNASVRIEGDHILAVGQLTPYLGETVIDGGGKFLVPGFIDNHSHHEGSLEKNPEALATLNQGITTIAAGQDGDSYPIDSIMAGFARIPKAINVATYTGQTTLREMVMGESQLGRACTDSELVSMQNILAAEMKKGSLGLSTGLEYEGAFYSSRHEVIELAKTAAAQNGRYISHIRSEDINMDDAIDEIIQIGKQAKIPVQVTHIKIAYRDDWGTAPSLLARLQQARSQGVNITADCYPYEFWNSTVRVLFPKKDFTSLAGAQYAVDHLFDPEGSVMVRFAPDTIYKGKTVAEIARMRKETPAQTLLYLVASSEAYRKQHPDAGGVETIMGKSMSDADIQALLAWPFTSICSDGANGGHPRGYGAFTRVLSSYVRDKKIMSFEQAIYKMTGLAAENIGLKNRGIITEGYAADLVLLDPQTVKDNASIQNPKALSDGILQVWVNGELVYNDKQATGKYPGRFLKK